MWPLYAHHLPHYGRSSLQRRSGLPIGLRLLPAEQNLGPRRSRILTEMYILCCIDLAGGLDPYTLGISPRAKTSASAPATGPSPSFVVSTMKVCHGRLTTRSPSRPSNTSPLLVSANREFFKRRLETFSKNCEFRLDRRTPETDGHLIRRAPASILSGYTDRNPETGLAGWCSSAVRTQLYSVSLLTGNFTGNFSKLRLPGTAETSICGDDAERSFEIP
jgi:hypothetical protein